MWIELEMVLSSYKPLSLEKGMWFVQKLHHGTIKETINLFELDHIPQDQEQFIQQNGYPIEVKIINSDGEVVVLPHEIGWWDEGDHTDEFRDITIKDIGFILSECNGMVDLLIDDNSGEVIIEEDKVILRVPGYENNEKDEEEYEDETCSSCNGSGEGMYDGSICNVCNGLGVEQRDYEPDYDPDDDYDSYDVESKEWGGMDI
jgi:hypothetical protein